MTTKKDTEHGPAARAAQPDELRTDIERTREDLGDTVAALAGKADVKARAKEAAGDAKGRALEGASTAVERAGEFTETVRRRPVPLAAAAGGLLAGVGAVMVVRRRRARAQRKWWRRSR
jgi:hypothetical protein